MAVLMEEEAAEVEVILETLKKWDSVTDKITRSMEKLSGSAAMVEKSVQPILSQTNSLTTLSQNIEAGINEIDKTMKLLDLVQREEGTIRRGPQTTGLTSYLDSIKRLNDGLKRLKTTNLKSSEKAVKDMTALLKTGAIQLEDLFNRTLSSESSPVEPLHYLTKQLPFPTFGVDKLNTLAVVHEFLSNTAQNSAGFQAKTPQIYAEVRGPYIASTLSSLAQGSVNTAQKRTAATYEKGDNGIVHYTLALEKMFEAEYENICRLFNAPRWGTVYVQTTQPAMTVFSNTVRQLNAYVKSNMMSDCFLAYDVIECVNATAGRLGGKTGEKAEFVEALKPIRQTAVSSFHELLEDMKKRGREMTTLPGDNAVCELTNTVMGRLRRLTDYPGAVTGLLISLGGGNWNRPFTPTLPSTLQGFDVGADGNLLLCNYIVENIEQLLGLLEAKAKNNVKKPPTIAVLLINNISYIESQIKRSGLFGVLANSSNPNSGMQKIERMRKRYVEDYLHGWKECASFLLDSIYTSKTGSGGSRPQLSSKDKDAIKEKFKNFNTTFDDLVARHKSYVFPDREVKAMLVKEVSFIGPLYGRFYDKYHEVVKDKHIKYDRGQLDAQLASLN